MFLRSSLFAPTALVGGVALVLSACAPELDTTKTTSARGSLGQEIFSVLCDRVGASELREDLTGASFRGVCHDDGAGFVATVDASALPALTGDAKNQKGEIVTLADQQAERNRRIKRIETFGAKRLDMVTALDAIMPDSEMVVRTLAAPPNASGIDQSCNADTTKGSLHAELSTLLGNFGKLYTDGTVPATTQALARTLAVFRDSTDAREAYARLSTREGYRPASVGLGLIRPFASYPALRDMLTALIANVSGDSRPYEEVNGVHVATPGPSYDEFLKLLEIGSHEFANATADPAVPALVSTDDPNAALAHLNRPRQNLEMMEAMMLSEDPEYGGGQARYIVRRDARGLAQVAGGASMPSLFVDADKDGLPDIDATGQFVTTNGTLAPTPFDVPGLDRPAQRDTFGRATLDGALAYSFVDTTHTFTASLLNDSLPLFNPDPNAQHETLMDAMAGIYVVAGTRDGQNATTKTYADGTSVQYNQFKRDQSPLLDLVQALTQLVAEPDIDDTLVLAKNLAQTNEADLARVMKAVMDGRNLSLAHNEAQIPKASTLWDDLFEVLAQAAQEPGLLEDVMDSLSNDDTALLGPLLGKWATTKDQFSYDRNDLNASAVNVTAGTNSDPVTLIDPAVGDTGDNRSMVQRFLQLMNDGSGVASCNRANAQVKAKYLGIDLTVPPLGGTFKECEVYKVPDLDVFLLDAMVKSPKAQLYIRDSSLRNGQFLGLGKTTVGLMEDSAGMQGFYGDKDSTTLLPTAAWLARLVFFDINEQGTPNQRTQDFISTLNGEFTGSSICPERVIDDPCANGGCDFGGSVSIPSNVDADGKIHGLRSCQPGDWLADRNRNTLFMMERVNAYQAFTPMANAFVKHDREDLFIRLAIVLHKHWQTAQGTAEECRSKDGVCAKDGVSTYQPLIGELMVKDLLPSLVNLMKTAKAMTIKHCTATAADGTCTATEDRTGIQALANAGRILFDPTHAAQVDLRDRLGNVATHKNDGTPVAQTTPVYLLTNALSSFDAAYDAYEAANPTDAGRRTQFRRARSQLADQFLAISGDGATAKFQSRGVIKILPTLIDLMRSQTWANCPQTFGGGTLRCSWARDDLPKKLEDVMTGPLFASMVDLVDNMRKDDRTRQELEKMIVYMLDAASQNEALPAMLASSNDIVQLLRDDRNLVPFFKVLAAAVSPTGMGATAIGGTPPKSLIDSTLAMLGKVAGRYENVDSSNNLEEICSREIDPNQVMNVLLGTAVTPVDALGGKAPIEILLDVIADVNRVAPEEPKSNYDEADYAAISATTVDFLTNETRGMEQFYEIVRKGQERK